MRRNPNQLVKVPGHSAVLRRAFSLAELAVASTIMALLTTAIGSAIVLASRAVPNGKSLPEHSVAAARAVEALAAELTTADAVPGGNATTISITVPDRTGDGVSESVLYQWSGRPGDPLTRSINGSTPANVITNVRAFSLGYTTRLVTQSSLGGVGVNPESLLLSTDQAAGYTTAAETALNMYGEYFVPTLPGASTSWSVTKVFVRLASAGSATDGRIAIQLRSASGGLPTGTVLGQVFVDESTLSATPKLVEADFSGISLNPGAGVCVLLVHQSGLQSCNVCTLPLGSSLDYAQQLTSVTGLIWLAAPTSATCMQVYGAVTAPTYTATTHTLLEGVTISLQTGDDNSPVVKAAARVLARPEITP